MIPLVAACKWVKPISLAIFRISMNLGWIVGSPPENCTTRPSTGLSLRSAISMVRTCSMSGSYRYPAAFALAKQTGQVRLQRLVRSTLASALCEVCSEHSPQSSGQ